jgi:hypothetical protein
VLWSFWVACGMAATGAIAPLLLADGGASRISGGAIAFGVAAVAMAANALSYPRGRSVATALYILAWLAIVYAILRMVAVPLQLAVVGTCPATEIGCGPGFASAFNSGEGAGIGVGLVMGALALQTGYFGLRILYRGPRKPTPASPATAPAAPSPVTPPPEAAPSPPPAVEEPAAASAPAPAPRPARKPRIKRSPEPVAELPPPSEPAELPAHPEPAELPPHEDSSDPSSSPPSSS